MAKFGTKEYEYERSAELFIELINAPTLGGSLWGPYFALALLADSQYDNADLHAIVAKMRDLPGAIKKVDRS